MDRHPLSSEGDASTVAFEEDIQRALANLQLPHMPIPFHCREPARADSASSKKKSAPRKYGDDSPTAAANIRILVVADIDLESASALSEYTLKQQQQHQQQQNRNSKHRTNSSVAPAIDLCIACGPFCRDEDLGSYLAGQQQSNSELQRKRQLKQQQTQQFEHQIPINSSGNNVWSTPTSPTFPTSPQPQQQQQTPLPGHGESLNVDASASASKGQGDMAANSPFFRTREQTAALEGLFTAALSQLESIVCRVVYCPGSTDPITTLVSAAQRDSLRLTPNSRNLQYQWLQLAPALGCGAILYLNSPESVLPPTKFMKQQQSIHSSRGVLSSPVQQEQQQRDSHERDQRHVLHSLTADFDDISEDEDLDDEAADGDEQDDDDEQDSEDDSDEEDAMAALSDQLLGMQQSFGDYYTTLSSLLQLAPKPQHQVPFVTEKAQTILITHYLDLSGDSSSSDLFESQTCDNANSSHQEFDAFHRADDSSGATSAAEQNFPLPWPSTVMQQNSTSNGDLRTGSVNSREEFLEADRTQELLCLEIASGSAKHHPSRLICKGKVKVLLPGSLRERGEFCLLDLSLLPVSDEYNTTPNNVSGGKGKNEDRANISRKQTPVPSASTSSRPRFAWQVSRVDFHNLNRLP